MLVVFSSILEDTKIVFNYNFVAPLMNRSVIWKHSILFWSHCLFLYSFMGIETNNENYIVPIADNVYDYITKTKQGRLRYANQGM